MKVKLALMANALLIGSTAMGLRNLTSEEHTFISNNLYALNFVVQGSEVYECQSKLWKKFEKIVVEAEDESSLKKMFDIGKTTDGEGSVEYNEAMFTLFKRNPWFIISFADKYFKGDLGKLKKGILADDSGEFRKSDVVSVVKTLPAPLDDDETKLQEKFKRLIGIK